MEKRANKKGKSAWLSIGALIAFSMAFILVALWFGYAKPTLRIILTIRLPRVLAAFGIGAALSASGASYQGVFKNPLVSPDILGVASGAGVGAALAIVLGLNDFYIQAFAFGFGILAVGFAYSLASHVKNARKVSMILAGTMVGALSLSVISLLKIYADVNSQLPDIVYWLMGSVAKVGWRGLGFSLPVMAFGFVLLFLLRSRLDVLTLSDEEAQSLGVNPKRYTRLIVIASTLMCSGAVALGGVIGWIGLFIPHISRKLVGAVHAKLLPVSALLGGCFLLIVDTVIRTWLVVEIPIGTFTALVGAPFFYMLIRKGGLK